MHYVSANPYSSHTSTLSFLELTSVQRLSNWIAYFHEHRENGLPFQKFSEFLPLQIVFCFVARGMMVLHGLHLLKTNGMCVIAGLDES